jgi:DNA-binding LacI/PurR family transcriptional regulator
MSTLLDEGLLYAEGRKGTFVAEKSSEACTLGRVGSKLAIDSTSDKARVDISILGIVNYIGGAIGQAIVSTIEGTFSKSGGATVSSERVLRSQLPEAAEVSEALIREGCNAIIHVATELTISELSHIVSTTRCAAVPSVIVSSYETPSPTLNVCHDNIAAGYEAAIHLLERGCRSIAFCGTQSKDAPWSKLREDGCRLAIADYGLPPNALIRTPVLSESATAEELSQFDAGYHAMKSLLPQHQPTGVIGANDYVALGAWKALIEFGLVVGHHVRVIGFDDVPGSREKGLSTMRPPMQDLGATAVDILYDAFSKNIRSRRVSLQSELVARASTSSSAFSMPIRSRFAPD